jgi:hypothetical protein
MALPAAFMAAKRETFGPRAGPPDAGCHQKRHGPTMKGQMMKYTEAIGLVLVIAAVLGGWVRSSFEPPNDPDRACMLRLEPGGAEVALQTLHCSHAAEMRTQHQPTVGHVQAESSQGTFATSHAGAQLAAAMRQPCDDAD